MTECFNVPRMVLWCGTWELSSSSVVNTSPSQQVLGGASTQETGLRESRVPEANALPSYRGGPLISDFGDWMVPVIEIGIFKGAPLLCVYRAEWEVFFFFKLFQFESVASFGIFKNNILKKCQG